MPESLDDHRHPSSPDAQLVAQLRLGDPAAGHRFFREQYPGVYRYLLRLTGRPDQAEDLAQDTFVRAWQSLDRFDDRWPLRPWLHRIAYREFLHALRRRRDEASLEETPEVGTAEAAPWTEAVELREVIRQLPAQEASVVALHYLEGYSSEEIARIVGLPAGTVRHRLSEARARLQQQLGEDDLSFLNEPSTPGTRAAGGRSWRWLPLEAMTRLQNRLCGESPGARAVRPESQEETMERREFLRQAAVGAAGVMLTGTEKEIIDSRLTQKVTCAFKGTALSDLCEKLKSDTGVHLAAGPSVADEKVTLFCERRPLREVMRQLSRPFGYTWLRSGTPGVYRYELVQDLRSQLLEEELRNRDRNAALLALDREIERYRPHLNLSPDEALARSSTAAPGDKKLLEALGKTGWGPLQLYFQLSPADQAALRAGQELVFSADPEPGQRPLPADVGRGVLQSLRHLRVINGDDGLYQLTSDLTDPRSIPLTAAPEARALVKLEMSQSELGTFVLEGLSGFFTSDHNVTFFTANVNPLAAGVSPTVARPDNAALNARLAGDPALRERVTVRPGVRGQGSKAGVRGEGSGVSPEPNPSALTPHPSPLTPAQPLTPEAERMTSADVLEALHHATGMPVVADFYTRLYAPEAVSVEGQPLFDALNTLGDTMRMRWQSEAGSGDAAIQKASRRGGTWLQFRSVSFYDDRLKEVPNRLLSRWAAARREHGHLTLDEILEIAQLPDAPLDAASMAEAGEPRFDAQRQRRGPGPGKELWGLAEWDLACYKPPRPHLHFLSTLSPAQRQEAVSDQGLPFTRMTLPQQQQFLVFALQRDNRPLRSMDELAGAALRVDYCLPGGFQWGDCDWGSATRWVVPLEPGPAGKRVLRPMARAATKAAALQALRQVEPRIREALQKAQERNDPRLATPPSDEAQIFPTELNLTIVYIPGDTNLRNVHVWYKDNILSVG